MKKCLILAVSTLTLALAKAETPASTPPPSPPPNYCPSGYFPGVNLSVAEFGKGIGQLGTTYTYPTDQEFAYFASKGFKIVRIPFKWERVQPQLLGELDPANLKELDRCVSQAGQNGLDVLLDVHNYGGREVNGQEALIGMTPTLTSDPFNDFWVKLGTHFKENPHVWIGLMNEPHKQTAALTAQIMQSAVNAIRAAGIKNRILVPGTWWTGAHSWLKSGNAAAFENFKDPGDSFAFEVHQYLDKDCSGTHTEAVAGFGEKSIADFTAWAKRHHFKAFLGEVGWDKDPANLQAAKEGEALLHSMDNNRDVWIGYTYWAAGPWWNHYMYTIEPEGLKEGAPVDPNQMQVLAKHLH